jgi:hypothetical protein
MHTTDTSTITVVGLKHRYYKQTELFATLADCDVYLAAYCVHTAAFRPQVQTTVPAEEMQFNFVCMLYAYATDQAPFTTVATKSHFPPYVHMQRFEAAKT